MCEELHSVRFGKKQKFGSFSAYFVRLVDVSSQFLFGTNKW